jgi:hypothetical protein
VDEVVAATIGLWARRWRISWPLSPAFREALHPTLACTHASLYLHALFLKQYFFRASLRLFGLPLHMHASSSRFRAVCAVFQMCYCPLSSNAAMRTLPGMAFLRRARPLLWQPTQKRSAVS